MCAIFVIGPMSSYSSSMVKNHDFFSEDDESLRWLGWDRHGGPGMSMEDLGWAWRTWDEHGGPGMGMEDLEWAWRT